MVMKLDMKWDTRFMPGVSTSSKMIDEIFKTCENGVCSGKVFYVLWVGL